MKSRIISRKHASLIGQLCLVLMVGVLLFVFAMPNAMDRNIYYNELLNVIAKGESGGNYNAYFGKPNNTAIKFTSMPLSEVLAWQKKYVENGSPSNAVGRYQFIGPTLHGLVKENNIDPSERFDSAMQDKLAIKLLERRGSHEFVDGKISKEQFAYNLSQEWAALPSVKGPNPKKSYYAGDGLNQVQVSVKEINRGIDSLHQNQTN